MKKQVSNQIFDEERSLYNIKNTEVVNCRFEGPADGESVLKEGRNYIGRIVLFLYATLCGMQKGLSF